MTAHPAADLRLQRVLDAAGVGYWELIPATGRLYVDPRLAGWLGATPVTSRQFAALIQDRQTRPDGTVRYRAGTRWIEERRVTSPGRDGRVVAACVDVTARYREERVLAWDAGHDPLTGLLGRRSFDRVLEQAVRGPHDSSAAVTLVMIDLDGFKQINDRFGHDTGDRVLRVVAHRLRSSLRRSDPLARWGGDEFCVVVGADPHELRAGRLAERLLREIREPLHADELLLPVRASVGLAVRRPGESAETLVRRADRALYAAKGDGGDRWCLEGWKL